MPTHGFWPEPEGGYAHNVFENSISRTLTHGLVTDGYLATLAAHHKGKLVTFDKQCALTFTGMVEWIGFGRSD